MRFSVSLILSFAIDSRLSRSSICGSQACVFTMCRESWQRCVSARRGGKI